MNNIILPNPISKEYINRLPIIRYNGAIKIISNKKNLEESLAKLESEDLIGFDTETRPAFVSGQSYPTSLIQLATADMAYLIQLKKTGITDPLVKFFENEKIKKIGVALLDDIRGLQKIHLFEPAGFIDLASIAAHKGIIQTGLRALSSRYLGQRISKSMQTSNWSVPDLSERQKRYAATDAWISLKIYPALMTDKRDYLKELEEE